MRKLFRTALTRKRRPHEEVGGVLCDAEQPHSEVDGCVCRDCQGGSGKSPGAESPLQYLRGLQADGRVEVELKRIGGD